MYFLKILKRPHPFVFNTTSVVLPGLITFLTLVVFQPLGFHRLPFSKLLLVAGCIGGIVALSIWMVMSLGKRGFPVFFEEDNWTIFKEVLVIMSVILWISLIIFGTLAIFQLTENDIWDLLFTTLFKTLALSIFPVLILVLYEQYRHQKEKRKAAEVYNQQLIQQAQETLAQHKLSQLAEIVLQHENGKIALRLLPQDILYLQAAGNYVEVFYQDKHEAVQKKLLRNRLKIVLATLPAEQFFHCHKSYIINVNAIREVRGNARNFTLLLKGLPTPIPVARAKSALLREVLQSQTS